MEDNEDTEALDGVVQSTFISRNRTFSVLLRIDEMNEDGEILNTVHRFPGIESGQDIAHLIEELKQAKQRIAELEALTSWDEERRNKLVSLLESYAHTHRQFYFPAMTEFDTEDTDVRDDIKALWSIRRQIGELIGIPPMTKDEVQS